MVSGKAGREVGGKRDGVRVEGYGVLVLGTASIQ